MPNVIVNANGTISNSFSIGKSGVVIYQGDGSPSEIIGNIGDIYIKRSTEPLLMQKTSSGWENVVSGSGRAVIPINQSTLVSPSQPDAIYLIDSSSSSVTLTIDSDALVSGKQIVIKDSSGNASTNTITVDTEGTETIDGQSSIIIESNYTSITLISDGNNWFII